MWLEADTLAPDTGSPEDDCWQAMVLGLRDYVQKNGFSRVVLGLSGGIDSAVVATVAVDALGAENVLSVMLPSPFTSDDSLEDAGKLAKTLGIRLETVEIFPAMKALEGMLAPLFRGKTPDIAEENLQARLRGLVLMAISNKFGHLLLTTGNKSEMAVGYATLYGDMCGGYNVLKDIYKTQVYALSRWRNANLPDGVQGKGGALIPERILVKAPAAELKPNQTDQDTLPPYDVLDGLLEQFIEERKSVEQVVAGGADAAVAQRVWTLLNRAEYKRRQAAPGVKVTSSAFGRDWRYPLTQKLTNS